MLVLGSVIDWGALLKVVAVSLMGCAVLGLGLGYSIVGATRSAELRRQGRDGAATVYGVLGLLAFAVVVGCVALGLIVMTHK